MESMGFVGCICRPRRSNECSCRTSSACSRPRMPWRAGRAITGASHQSYAAGRPTCVRAGRARSERSLTIGRVQPHHVSALPQGALRRLHEEMIAEQRIRLIAGMKRYAYRKRHEGAARSAGDQPPRPADARRPGAQCPLHAPAPAVVTALARPPGRGRHRRSWQHMHMHGTRQGSEGPVPMHWLHAHGAVWAGTRVCGCVGCQLLRCIRGRPRSAVLCSAGLLSSMGLRMLEHACDSSMEHPETPIDVFGHLHAVRAPSGRRCDLDPVHAEQPAVHINHAPWPRQGAVSIETGLNTCCSQPGSQFRQGSARVLLGLGHSTLIHPNRTTATA